MTSRATITTREIASSTVATAAAPGRLSFSTLLRMRTDVTSVWKGRLPDRRTRETYSLTPRAQLSAPPAASAGTSLSSATCQHVVSRADARTDVHVGKYGPV